MNYMETNYGAPPNADRRPPALTGVPTRPPVSAVRLPESATQSDAADAHRIAENIRSEMRAEARVDHDPVKIFGGGAEPAKPIKFGLVALRDGVEEKHYFTAIPVGQSADLVAIMRAQSSSKTEDVIAPLMKLLGKVMANNDGVPRRWEFKQLPQDVDDNRTPLFRGPDGEYYEVTDRERVDSFTAYAAGSSRRRWFELLEGDEGEDVSIDLNDLMAVAKWVMSEASGRPTVTRD